MKLYLRTLLLSASLCLFLQQANSQAKPAKTTKKVKAKEESIQEPPPPPPPPPEGLRKVRIDTSSAGRRMVVDEPAENYLPPVDFDTTAAPDDQFSKDILRVLELSNGMNMGMQLAEAMQTEKDESIKEFYDRFLKDYKEGTSRRWLERLYVKTYRQRFTHEDVKEMIRFYETPVGKKLISQTTEMLPGIIQQGKSIGTYQAMRIYMEMMKEKNK